MMQALNLQSYEYGIDLLTPTPVGESLWYRGCVQMEGVRLGLWNIVIDTLVVVVHSYTQDLFCTFLTHYMLV